MARVERDIDECVGFVARQPWGRPRDRERDIRDAIRAIALAPLRNPVRRWRRDVGLAFRKQNAAQFAIIYTYLDPSPKWPAGLVSIRAVRHRRARDVFRGVREVAASYGPPFASRRPVPGG